MHLGSYWKKDLEMTNHPVPPQIPGNGPSPAPSNDWMPNQQEEQTDESQEVGPVEIAFLVFVMVAMAGGLWLFLNSTDDAQEVISSAAFSTERQAEERHIDFSHMGDNFSSPEAAAAMRRGDVPGFDPNEITERNFDPSIYEQAQWGAQVEAGRGINLDEAMMDRFSQGVSREEITRSGGDLRNIDVDQFVPREAREMGINPQDYIGADEMPDRPARFRD